MTKSLKEKVEKAAANYKESEWSDGSIRADQITYAAYDFTSGASFMFAELVKGGELGLDTNSIEENVVEKWSLHWFDQKINEEDTANYRRRIMSVDANMRYSIARMMSEYVTQALASANAKIKELEELTPPNGDLKERE